MNINPISIGFLGLGGLALIFQLRNVRKALKSRHWIAVSGEITASALDVSIDSEGHRTILPHILYRYRGRGKEYEGRTVSYGRGYTRGEVRRILNKYPVGKRVRVYVNPEDAEESCLERGTHLSGWAGVALAAGFVVVGYKFLMA